VTETKASPPPWMLWLQLSYIVILVGISLAYANLSGLRSVIHDPAGPVPLSVPWWGALGAVTISMTGLFRNRNRWDASFNLWHISRPVIGAIAGSVGYLIFIVVIRSTGANPSGTAPSSVVFDLVAFLVGYREAVFRELLQRATDVLLKPSDSATSAPPAGDEQSQQEST
jgi:hypothetical protein